MKNLAPIALLCLLVACGGGNSSSGSGGVVANASPGGIWNGTDSISGLQTTGLVDEMGHFHFIRTDGAQYVGKATVSVNSVSAGFEGYVPFGLAFPDGATHGTGTLSGTVVERSSLNGNVQFTTDTGNVSSGTIALTFDSLYNSGSSLSAISGNYTDPTSGDTVWVSSTGAIFSQDLMTGCVINGHVSIINSSYDAYSMSYSYAGCTGSAAVLNGVQFSGLGALLTNVNPVQAIIGVTGNSGAIKYALTLVLSRPPAAALPVVVSGYSIQTFATGFGAISGMTMGSDGYLYVADNGSGRILRVAADGSVTVVASGVANANGVARTDTGRLFTASGGSQAVFEVTSGTATVFANSGLSSPTSVAAFGNALYASNSGDGTVSRIGLDASVSQVLSGFSAPSGPYGISFGPSGIMYFIDHATGGVYSYDFVNASQLLATVSGFGGTFTALGFGGRLFATDVALGNLMMVDGSGGTSIFASGFSAKASPPAIGPNGIAYDNTSMYVADGGTIYRIAPL